MTNPDDPHRAWAFVAPEPLAEGHQGPLTGLRFSVKDLYGVADWPLTASTCATVPDPGESVLVRRLLQLGAAAVGKTHLHEIAMGITGMNGYGGTSHPVLAGHIPGGSSSGAAVSVALGASGTLKVDFALGTDTGGSIRVPAAWCGVVGFKPGKHDPDWSTEGVLPLSWTCDHAGPLARDVSTIVKVQEALTGRPIQAQEWRGLRVGLWLPEGWTDTVVNQAVLDFAEQLEREGAVVERVPFPEVMDAYSPIVMSEAAQVHREALKELEPAFMPFTLASLRSAEQLSAQAIGHAFRRREEYRALLDGIFMAYDLLLAPAVPTPPPLTGQEEVELGEGTVTLRRAVLRLNAPFSLLGVPVVSYPSNVPYVGVQLIAPQSQDDRLLGLVLTLEQRAAQERSP